MMVTIRVAIENTVSYTHLYTREKNTGFDRRFLMTVSYTHLDSEIETVARECIAATVAYILEWFGIPIDTEEAIRERDW